MRIKTGIFVVVNPLGSKMTEAATENVFYRENAQTETSSNSFTRSSPFTYSPHSRSLSFQSFCQLFWVKLPLPGMTRFWCSLSFGALQALNRTMMQGRLQSQIQGWKTSWRLNSDQKAKSITVCRDLKENNFPSASITSEVLHLLRWHAVSWPLC